jgi:hypothetical protein
MFESWHFAGVLPKSLAVSDLVKIPCKKSTALSRTWKGGGEATNKNALVYYVSKRREPRGEKYGYGKVGGEGSRA